MNVDPGTARETLRDLEARKRDLERLLTDENEASAVEIHPNVAELYRRKVGELQKLLTDEACRVEAMEIIRSLIERIEVHAGEKRGEAEVVLVGALTRILDFASGACGQQKPPPRGEAAVVGSYLLRGRATTFVCSSWRRA